MWHQLLKDQLDLKKSQCKLDSLTAAKLVWQLGSRLIITTNYDRVLDWSCPADCREDLSHWQIETPFELQQALTKSVDRPTL